LSEEQRIVAKQDNARHPGMDTFGNRLCSPSS